VCAFSDEEIRQRLSKDGELTPEYFEKFFPVSIPIAAPDPALVGRLFTKRIKTRFSSKTSWFATKSAEKQFSDLLDQAWKDYISRVCTNFRKMGLLVNDVSSAARLIEREVNAFDLVALNCLRRFYPKVHDLARNNPVFLKYEQSGVGKDQYFLNDEGKVADSKIFFEQLASQTREYPNPEAVWGLLSYMFPQRI